MDQKPQFSILLTFQDQRDEVEPSLTTLYELEMIPFELILIDDASSDGTGPAIHSLLDYYQHDYTFFFEHGDATGRGNCLNEALQQSSTPVIWTPRSFQALDEEALRTAIKNLRQGSSPCLIQNTSLPRKLSGWAEFITHGNLPADGQLLWNLEHVPSRQQFFNPFLQQYHGIDWLLRLGMDTLEVGETFFTPSVFGGGSKPSVKDRQELLMSLLRRPSNSAENRQKLTQLLLDLPSLAEPDTADADDADLLETAAKLKLEGKLSAALELVEKVLANEPGNMEAKRQKIKLLERQRRFVEASELKHELQTDAKPQALHPRLSEKGVKTSIIIPTALHGKRALEHCLISVNKHCSPASTELIIIDNASLDDTHDYLQELEEKNFFNCNIVINQQNKGFAASVNQGLQAARGKYACIIHNDVELKGPSIPLLEQLMDEHPDYALMGPLVDSTLNPDQLASNQDAYNTEVVPTDYLDSFCMIIRTDAELSMDEKYTLAFFDDIDICFEARKKGYKVGIASNAQVTHHYGTTTFALDLDTESELYWKNISYFNEKWDIETYSQEALQSKSSFEQLLTLDEWVNPLYPEPRIKEKFNKLFTDELKTEMMNATHDSKTLQTLVHLMMVMEKRDVMRKLEDRMDDDDLPAALIYELVRFYFNRNVYSRCLHYLNQLTGQQESLQSDLYRLAILIDEKKIEEAIPMLTKLLDRAPSNPLLYKLAGDVHAFENNTEEAESFYTLARQINPFEYTETQQEIRLNS